MADLEALLPILACPRTGSTLHREDGFLVNADDSCRYPIRGEVPIFVDDPAAVVTMPTQTLSNSISEEFEAQMSRARRVLHLGAGGSGDKRPNCAGAGDSRLQAHRPGRGCSSSAVSGRGIRPRGGLQRLRAPPGSFRRRFRAPPRSDSRWPRARFRPRSCNPCTSPLGTTSTRRSSASGIGFECSQPSECP